MIKSFKHRGLRELFERGRSARVSASLQNRALRRLDALDAAERVSELKIPGFDFHPLRGHKPRRYTIHVKGPWCITFEFRDGDAYAVDFEQYH